MRNRNGKSRVNRIPLITSLLIMSFAIGCESVDNLADVPPLFEATKDEIESYIADGNPARALQGIDVLKRDGSDMPRITIEALQQDASEALDGMFAAAVESRDFDKALSVYRSAVALSGGETLGEAYDGWSEASLLRERSLEMLENGERIASYVVFSSALDAGLVEQDPALRIAEAAVEDGYRPLLEALSDILDDGPTADDVEPVSPEKLLKGTVTIFVNKGIRLDRGVGYPDSAIGSGFFIDYRGYVLTNYHVIESEVNPEYEGFSRLYIRLHDSENEKIPAQVVGWDSVLDIALLKAEIKPEYIFPLDSHVVYGPGDEIYAIGSPGGLRNTVTSGIVSATGRRFLQVGSTVQVDVPVNPGNSGGPLINVDGGLIGVVFAGIEQFEGINFAIPAEWVIDIVTGLYDGGAVEHSWLGVAVEESRKGLEVAYSLPGAAAGRSGIVQGDRLLSINGTKVATVEEAQALLIGITPDTLIHVEWDRDGETLSGLVSMDKRPERPLDVALERDVYTNLFPPLFGMVVEETGSYFWERGYAIRRVYAGSIADETGLSENDPLSIQDWEVDDDNRVAYLQILVKKKKAGFIERAIQLGAYLEVDNFI